MKKGFTLVELLAVIVILSLLALILIPVVSNIVEKSREKAAELSATNYLEAVKSQIGISVTDPNLSFPNGDYDVASLKNNYGVTVKGDYPTSGSVNILDKEISSANICISKYSVIYLNGIISVLGKCSQVNYDASKIKYHDTTVENALNQIRAKLNGNN